MGSTDRKPTSQHSSSLCLPTGGQLLSLALKSQNSTLSQNSYRQNLYREVITVEYVLGNSIDVQQLVPIFVLSSPATRYAMLTWQVELRSNCYNTQYCPIAVGFELPVERTWEIYGLFFSLFRCTPMARTNHKLPMYALLRDVQTQLKSATPAGDFYVVLISKVLQWSLF